MTTRVLARSLHFPTLTFDWIQPRHIFALNAFVCSVAMSISQLGVHGGAMEARDWIPVIYLAIFSSVILFQSAIRACYFLAGFGVLVYLSCYGLASIESQPVNWFALYGISYAVGLLCMASVVFISPLMIGEALYRIALWLHRRRKKIA